VKLVKGEGRATRARSLARLAAPGRGRGRGRGRVVSCRVESRRDHDAYALFLSFMLAIILCIKTTVTGN
jgi:hypothetical protein